MYRSTHAAKGQHCVAFLSEIILHRNMATQFALPYCLRARYYL